MPTPAELISIYSTQSQIGNFFIDKVGQIWVSAYGAVGDGVTDDTAKVQDAVDAAIANGSNEVYFVSGKTYKITALTDTTGITFLGNNVTITGGSTITVNSLTSHLAETTKICINVMAPPTPLAAAKANANYYNAGKWYEDAAFTIQATNDAPAINACLAYVESAGGGVVIAPRGSYLIEGTTGGNFINMKTKVRFFGSGINVTILRLGSVSGLSNGFISWASGATDTEIAYMTLDGGENGTTMQMGLYLYTCVGAYIHDLYIDDMYCSLGNVYLKNSQKCVVERVYVKVITTGAQHGIGLEATAQSDDYHKILNCTIEGGGFGFYVKHSSRNTFENCIAFSSTFINCLEGFNIDGGVHNEFLNCLAHGRGDGGYVETNVRSGVYPIGNRVSDFTAIANKLVGVVITASQSIYSGIVTYNNGQGAVAGQDEGIQVFACSNNIISNILAYDNQSTATQKYGIRIASGASNILVSNIQGTGNTTGLFVDENTTKSNGEIKFAVNNNGANQVIPTGVATKLLFSTEVFDIGGCFADSTFTPKKAGQYHLQAVIYFTTAVDQQPIYAAIYKNGVGYKYGARVRASGTDTQGCDIDCLVDANGTTDYFEVYVYQGAGSDRTVDHYPARTYFEGFYLP